MNRDATIYLSDIIENIDSAVQFISGLTFEQFIGDKKTVYAAVRSIEIIGEATKNIPPEMRARQSNVPWKNMAGMRDKCIHDYFGIDYEVVWTAIKNELPMIRLQVQSLLGELRQEGKK